MNWYLEVLKKYADFDGRAHRTEYWMFFLVNFIIAIVLNVLASQASIFSILAVIYSLATLIPGIAVAIRRLHDTNRSGWWLLIAFVPLIGAIVLIVFFIQPSHPASNQYGPVPA